MRASPWLNYLKEVGGEGSDIFNTILFIYSNYLCEFFSFSSERRKVVRDFIRQTEKSYEQIEGKETKYSNSSVTPHSFTCPRVWVTMNTENAARAFRSLRSTDTVSFRVKMKKLPNKKLLDHKHIVTRNIIHLEIP